MIKKIAVLSALLLATSSTHPMLDNIGIVQNALSKLPPKELHAAACKAVRQKDHFTSTLLLRAGAKPPLFTAAKIGNRSIATKVAKSADDRSLKTTPKKRRNVLNRLILTGDQSNLETYFTHKVLTAADITPESIVYAKRRARIATNKHILKYLKKRSKAAKLQKKLKAGIQFDQTECAICLDDFKDGEIKILPCKHVFHPACTKEWFKSRGFEQCAVCKKPESPLGGRTPSNWLNWIYN